MKALYGSKFATCPCGRPDVLLYKRGEADDRGAMTDASNGPEADRLTLHDTPAGVACEYGGKLLADLPKGTRP